MQAVELNTGLNDLSGWADAFDLGFLTENRAIYEASQRIQSALCYNMKQSRLFCDIDLVQIREILHTYIQLAINPKFEYYDDKNSQEKKDIVITQVAAKAGQTKDLTARVLRQLYWFTKDNTIKTSAILYPRETELATENTKESGILGPLANIGGKIVDTAGNVVLKTSEGIDSAAKVIKYIPYIALALGVGYVSLIGMNIYNSTKVK